MDVRQPATIHTTVKIYSYSTDNGDEVICSFDVEEDLYRIEVCRGQVIQNRIFDRGPGHGWTCPSALFPSTAWRFKAVTEIENSS